MKYVKLGMITRNDKENAVIYGINETIKHHNYNPRIFNDDIALIKLNSTVTFSSFINSICLPSRPSNHLKAIVTGFGVTGFNHVLSESLLEVTLEKFSEQECRRFYHSRFNEDSMLCYGHHSEMKNTCQVSSFPDLRFPLKVSQLITLG